MKVCDLEDKTNLGGTSGYVPDEVAVPSSINDGDDVSKRRREMLMVLLNLSLSVLSLCTNQP